MTRNEKHPARSNRYPAQRLGGCLLLFLVWLGAAPALAQPDEAATEALALTEELTTRFDGMIATVEQQAAEATRIEQRLAGVAGVPAQILERRLEDERIDVIEGGVDFARAVEAQDDAGFIVDEYRDTAAAMLVDNLEVANVTWDSLAARTAFPATDLSAAEQAARNRLFYETQQSLNHVIRLMGDSFELLDGFGTAVEIERTAFVEGLRDRGVNASIYLELAEEAALAARASANAVPGDSEVSAQLNVATSLVTQTANLFDRVVTELERLGDNTAIYRQQIISATGEITPDAINVSVISTLVSEWSTAIVDAVGEHGPAFVFRALVFIVILFVFYKLSRIARALAERGVNRSEAALSQLLKRMLVAVVANLVLAIGILIALSQLGISLGPLLAGLGIAGFIIGFALQDSLANFASGLMILFYRPYDVGDIVEVGGVFGKVDQMSLVNTTVNTFDNERIIVPNSMIWGSTIKNVTAETTRRVDMVFGISYSDDIPTTEEILRDIVTSHELVLDEPAPVVKLHELGDSSVNFVVRPWTQTSNYWDVYWDVTRAVKLRFDEAAISIPFPQRDVHLFTEPALAVAGREALAAPE